MTLTQSHRKEELEVLFSGLISSEFPSSSFHFLSFFDDFLSFPFVSLKISFFFQVGTAGGEFRARRRWFSTTRPAPGGGKGVTEDREGVPAGALAAAYALGGPAT